MSVLEDVLFEEYERSIRQKKAWKKALRNEDMKDQWPSYRQSLKRTKKDLWMLRRALCFRLLRCKVNKE